MDPFDLKGPEFLVFYIFSMVALLITANMVKLALRTPNDDPARSIELDPYEIAFLDGGDNKLADTVLTNLVNRGILRVGAVTNVVTRVGTLPADATELEKSIFEAADSPFDSGRAARSRFSTPILTMRRYASAANKPLIKTLREQGLLLSEQQELLAKWLPFLIAILAPLFIAMPKILIGISRGKPITFLIILTALNLFFAAALISSSKVLRSVRADKLLKRLKQANETLLSSAKSGANLPPDDLTRAFALWGVAALVSVPAMTELHRMLLPVYGTSTGGGSGGCSSGSSCSSGCGGGGGCGGCGG